MIISKDGAKPQAARRRAATRPADSAVQVRSTWRLGGRRKPAICPWVRRIFWASGRALFAALTEPAELSRPLRVTIPDAKARSPIARCGRSDLSLCPPSLPGSRPDQGQALRVAARALIQSLKARRSRRAATDRPTSRPNSLCCSRRADELVALRAPHRLLGSSRPSLRAGRSSVYFLRTKDNKRLQVLS